MPTSDSKFVALRESILDTPKVMRLTGEEFKFWILSLVAASRWDYVDGGLPDVERLAYWLRYTEGECEELLGRLEAARLVDRTDDGLEMHDWRDWRLVNDKGATTRQRRHREKKVKACHAPVTDMSRPVTDTSRACHAPVTPVSRPVTPIYQITETDTDAERERTHAGEASREVIPIAREVQPLPDESMTGRDAVDHGDFVKAVQILDGHDSTYRLGQAMRMNADVPEVRMLRGWQLVVGAIIAQRPDKSRSWGAFMAYSRNATQAEFDKIHAQAPARASPGASIPKLSDEELRAQTEEANRKVAEYRRKRAQT